LGEKEKGAELVEGGIKRRRKEGEGGKLLDEPGLHGRRGREKKTEQF